MNKQDPAAKREQAERVDRGQGAGFHLYVWVSRTGKSRGPGKRGPWRDQGSMAPLPHLADEEMDSAAASALLGGMGQVCAEWGWMGQNPSLEDAAPTCHKQHGTVDRQLAWGQDTWVLTVTLPHIGWLWTNAAPPWDPAAPPLWWEDWTKQRTFTFSFEIHSEGDGPCLGFSTNDP